MASDSPPDVDAQADDSVTDSGTAVLPDGGSRRQHRAGTAREAVPETNTDSEPFEGNRVELAGLTKRFEETVAVDDIDLAIEPGELFVLLGPSGCGKTTTLRMIAGLESITEGTITVGDQDVSRTTPQNRDVAMVFQSYALYPHFDVRENIRFPLRKMDLEESEIGERIESTAELLDIRELLDKRPASLSGGQRQRVAVGRAIARRPSVLLMDEPLSNLDAKLSVQTRSELRDLQQRLGITTVYVTHDQEEAMSIADRIAVMNGGEIAQVGTPEEVYREPNSEFIATFLGDPSMNLFDVEGGGPVVDAIEADLPSGARRIGVRPEDLFLVSDVDVVGDAPERQSEPIDCEVVVVEPIGRAYEMTLDAGETRFHARMRSLPAGIEETDRVAVTFDRDAVTAFGANGRRIDNG